MIRLRLFLSGLLALLLLGQSAAAAAHCLRALNPLPATVDAALSGLSWPIPICTPEGMRLLDATPDAPEDESPAHFEVGFCLACHALPQALLPVPPFLPKPAWTLVAAQPLPEAPPPRPFARGPPGLPRGPPLG